MDETYLGYPQHACLVEGHLDQAAAEAIQAFPTLAMTLRTFRRAWSEAFNKCISGQYTGVDLQFPSVEALMEELHNVRITVLAEQQFKEERSAAETQFKQDISAKERKEQLIAEKQTG